MLRYTDLLSSTSPLVNKNIAVTSVTLPTGKTTTTTTSTTKVWTTKPTTTIPQHYDERIEGPSDKLTRRKSSYSGKAAFDSVLTVNTSTRSSTEEIFWQSKSPAARKKIHDLRLKMASHGALGIRGLDSKEVQEEKTRIVKRKTQRRKEFFGAHAVTPH